jgi:transcriptional regulator with XRE-family HTH domain
MSDPATLRQRDRKPLLRTILGNVLRRTRLKQGRTLADVARSARVSMPYLSELERGRKEASSEILAALCDALGVELSDLLAAVGRELGYGPGRLPSVVRLDSLRDPGASGRASDSGTAIAGQDEVAGGSEAMVRSIGGRVRGSGTIVGQLAA